MKTLKELNILDRFIGNYNGYYVGCEVKDKSPSGKFLLIHSIEKDSDSWIGVDDDDFLSVIEML